MTAYVFKHVPVITCCLWPRTAGTKPVCDRSVGACSILTHYFNSDFDEEGEQVGLSGRPWNLRPSYFASPQLTHTHFPNTHPVNAASLNWFLRISNQVSLYVVHALWYGGKSPNTSKNHYHHVSVSIVYLWMNIWEYIHLTSLYEKQSFLLQYFQNIIINVTQRNKESQTVHLHTVVYTLTHLLTLERNQICRDSLHMLTVTEHLCNTPET